MTSEQSGEIEWNSMKAVLMRLDKLTWRMNDARDSRRIDVLCDCIVNYYKEISVDLKEEEKDIWKKIKKLKRLTTPLVAENTEFVLNLIDEVDLELRALAKKHGYLTKNKETGAGAMVG